MNTEWWNDWPFLVATEVARDHGIKVAADLSAWIKISGAGHYMAMRVADRRPVVVDFRGEIVWEGCNW